MAILLQRPDTARARPSSLLKKNEDYEKLYSDSYPIQLYYTCAEAMRRVEEYLKSPASGLVTKDRNNLRFYVAMHAVATLCGKARPIADDLAKLDLLKLDDKCVDASLVSVKAEYDILGGTDQAAKGTALLEVVKAKLVTVFQQYKHIG